MAVALALALFLFLSPSPACGDAGCTGTCHEMGDCAPGCTCYRPSGEIGACVPDQAMPGPRRALE
jgi:hypothetical protein